MKYKTITIVIAILLTIIMAIGAMITANAQATFQAHIINRCQGTKDNCRTVKGLISITKDTLYIKVDGIEKHAILRQFNYKHQTYYDLKSIGCIGFFVLRTDYDAAILSVHTSKKGHVTEWYRFKEL